MSDSHPLPPLPDSSRQEKLGQILAEHLQLVEKGVPHDREELVASHPDLADDLRAFFRNRDLMDRAEAPTVVGPAGGTVAGETIHYFGDYEVLAEIARGGMGVVYKARQVSLNRTVALKMILAGQLAGDDSIERFQREAEAAANLDHPNIVPIYEVGAHGGQHYFSMKFIEGTNLSKSAKDWGWPSRSRESLRNAVVLIAKVARAVHHAHQRGILHRDLKPGNILIDGSGEPLVTDFGLAKRMEGNESQTCTGIIVGTPSYMSPEQARMEKGLTTAVDVYGLGAILYEALTGRPPFRAETPLNTVLQVLNQAPETPRKLNPAVDRDLQTICLKCLAKDRERRYGSAADFAADLDRWHNGETILARPAGVAERCWKWIRRNPLPAALLVLGVVSATILMMASQVTRQATKARDNAVELSKAIGYAQSVAVVERMIDAGDFSAADNRLASMDPELRSWEWNALRRRTRAELRFLAAPKRLDASKAKVFLIPAVSHATLLPGIPDVAAFRSNGMVNSEDEGELVLWDSSSGEIVGSHTEVFKPFAISADGQLFASPEKYNGAIAIREMASGRVQGTLPNGGELQQALVFSPDRSRLAVGSRDEKGFAVFLWDVETRKEVCRFSGHLDRVVDVSFSPDGRRIATASETADELFLWDTSNGDRLAQFKQPGKVKALAFSPRGDLLASSDGDSLVFWDVNTGTAKRTISQQGSIDDYLGMEWNDGLIGAIAFSPDGSLMATEDSSGSAKGPNEPSNETVRLWEVETGQQVLRLRGAIGQASRLSFSPDGRRLAWCYKASSVTICDFERLQTESTLRGAGPVAVSPDGRFVAHSDGRVHVRDTINGRLVREPMGDLHWPQALGVAFSHNGKRVAGGSSNWIWDVATGQKVVALDVSAGPARDISFSPDDRLVILAASQSVKVCDALTGKVRFNAIMRDSTFSCAAFSADGKRLVTGGKNYAGINGAPHGKVTIWDVETWTRRRELEGLFEGATSVAWSPDGMLVAACAGRSSDTSSPTNPHEVLVWDANTGEQRLRLEGHAAEVNAVRFTPDGRRLLTASSDHTLKLWDVSLGLEVLTLKSAFGLDSLSMSRDGSVLAAGGDDRNQGGSVERLRIWRASPFESAPEGFRHPLREAAPGRNVNDMLPRLLRPLAQFQAPDDRRSVMTADLSAYLVPNGTSGITVFDGTGSIPRDLPVTEYVTALAVGDAGLVVAAANGPVQQTTSTYDQQTKQEIWTVSGKDGPGEVVVWDLRLGKVRCVFRGHSQPVSSVAVSADGTLVASASWKEKTVNLWSAETGEKRTAIEGCHVDLVFASDGQRIMGSRYPTKETAVFDVQSSRVINLIPNNLPGAILPQRLSADGRKIIRIGPAQQGVWETLDPSKVQIIDVESGKVEQEIVEPRGLIRAVAVGPGPGQVTTVSGNQAVRVWDLATGRPIRSYSHEQFNLQRAFLSADGRRLGIYSHPDGVRVWDVNRLPTLLE